MDHLHQQGGQIGSLPHPLAPDGGVQPGGEQHDRRTDAFPACGERIAQHVGKQFPFSREIPNHKLVESIQIGADRFADLIECNHKRQPVTQAKTARIPRNARRPDGRRTHGEIPSMPKFFFRQR